MEIHVNIEEDKHKRVCAARRGGEEVEGRGDSALIRLFCILLKLLGKIHLPHDGNNAECKLGHLRNDVRDGRGGRDVVKELSIIPSLCLH